MNTKPTITRRNLARGAAWAAPVIIATSTIPAYAASQTPTPDQCPTYTMTQTAAAPDGSTVTYDFTLTFPSNTPLLDYYITPPATTYTERGTYTTVSGATFFKTYPAQITTYDNTLWQVVDLNGSPALKYIGPREGTITTTVTFTNVQLTDPVVFNDYKDFVNNEGGFNPDVWQNPDGTTKSGYDDPNTLDAQALLLFNAGSDPIFSGLSTVDGSQVCSSQGSAEGKGRE